MYTDFWVVFNHLLAAYLHDENCEACDKDMLLLLKYLSNFKCNYNLE